MNGLQATLVTLLAAVGSAAAVFPLKAADGPPTKVSEAHLRNSKSTTPTMRLAQYDGETGMCTVGSLQLMTKEQIAERKAEWNDPETGGDCRDPAKKPVRTRALYPVDHKGRNVRGAAHLLLELDETGLITAVHPVCATDEAFARAAAATAAKLAFSPTTCAGKPLRSTILLPLAFNP